MVSYYLYRPAANDFAGVQVDLAKDSILPSIHRSDERLLESWTPLRVSEFEDNPPRHGDFPSLNNYWRVPIFSERAWKCLEPLIGYCCEPLPIIHPSGAPYFICHVMETIDALDEERSEFTRNQASGHINQILRWAFKGRLAGKEIFKLPKHASGQLLVSGAFRECVEANNLRGLRFKELPIPTHLN